MISVILKLFQWILRPKNRMYYTTHPSVLIYPTFHAPPTDFWKLWLSIMGKRFMQKLIKNKGGL